MVEGFEQCEVPTKVPELEYGLPPVLTVDEVAEFLRLNRKTVFKHIAAGKMPGRRVGERIVILRDALLKWLRSNEHALSSKKRRK